MFIRQILRPMINGTSFCRLVINTTLNRQFAIPKATKNLNNRHYIEKSDHILTSSHVKGIEYLRDARLNKGMAFTLEERQVLGIHGLIAPCIKTQEEQLELCKLSINRYQKPVNKYLYLSDLHDRNERLFFRFVSENLEELLPILYTPTVGQVCQKYGLVYRRARGLFITSNDRGYIYNMMKNWPVDDVKAIVVTDGERILGLGDLGAYGMGIPVGKLSLYTALAGIQPHQCLPILLDCGTNNNELLQEPLYIGLRQYRLVDKEYDDFVDEFMEAVVKRYGKNTLIQFEDFGNKNAFKCLEKYRDTYCTFNDDIQGTGAVAVGGLYASKALTGKNFVDHKIVFVGAGEAALGIANMCVSAMFSEGISLEEARSKIYMVDIDGLITIDRLEKLDDHQKVFAKDHEPIKNLLDIVKKLNPSILIGASATSGIFTPEILQHMAQQNERPIIFALSNPTSKAECTAQDAYEHTNGRVIFSSGSPFPPVEFDGKTYITGQGNNAYIFPGVALGVIATQSYHIPEEMFLIAAKEVAKLVRKEDLECGSIFPPLSSIREVSLQIAIAISKYAYCNKYATVQPEPKDKRCWLEEQLYNFKYTSAMPITWQWPEKPPEANGSKTTT